MIVNVHATHCHFSSLCKWKRPKWLLLLLNGTQYARPENGGTQYARSKLGGTQFARGWGGVTLGYGMLCKLNCILYLFVLIP